MNFTQKFVNLAPVPDELSKSDLRLKAEILNFNLYHEINLFVSLQKNVQRRVLKIKTDMHVGIFLQKRKKKYIYIYTIYICVCKIYIYVDRRIIYIDL